MRNYSIDILRSMIMLFIVIWHSIIHGIAISKSIDLTNLSNTEICNYSIIQLLAYLSSISVNCFVMISGYFLINSKQINYNRIIKIWIQVSFYSLIIFFILSGLGIIPFKITLIIKSLLPVTTNQYWFITVYIPLMLIAPYISKIIIGNSKKENTKIIIILSFITLTFIHINKYSFPIGSTNTNGMNIIWFIYLFLVGGYIRIYEPFKNNTKLLFYIFVSILVILSIVETFNQISTESNTLFYIKNNGVTFVFSVIFFLIINNSKINVDNIINKLLIKIAPYTFGVYLIHDNNFIRELLWYKNIFHFENHFNTYYFVLYILAISILIFSVCVIIDMLRNRLFQILHVDNIVTYIKIKSVFIFNHLYNKFIGNKI